MLNNETMNSKEFVEMIGISLTKLASLEKQGIITPRRNGRIRIYTEENLKQYEEHLDSTMTPKDVIKEEIKIEPEPEPVKENQIVSIIISEKPEVVSENTINVLNYCNANHIYLDENIILINESTLDTTQEILSKIKEGYIGKIVYSGDTYIGKLLEQICKEKMIGFKYVNEPEEEKIIVEKVVIKEDDKDSIMEEIQDVPETIMKKIKKMIIGGK